MYVWYHFPNYSSQPLNKSENEHCKSFENAIFYFRVKENKEVDANHSLVLVEVILRTIDLNACFIPFSKKQLAFNLCTTPKMNTAKPFDNAILTFM